MTHVRRWSPGDHIVLRLVGHDDGVLIGHPQIVVEDGDERVVLFEPAGTLVENRRTHDNTRAEAIPLGRLGHERVLPPTYQPPFDVVRLIPRGAAHAIELAFALSGQSRATPYQAWTSAEGPLRGIKINLQTPLRRTAIGFDTTDNSLDLVIGPDLRWTWKDLEQTRARVAAGLTFAEEFDGFLEEAQRVIATIESRRPPFTPEELAAWAAWRPERGWGRPSLPDAWYQEPGYDHDLNRRWPIDV